LIVTRACSKFHLPVHVSVIIFKLNMSAVKLLQDEALIALLRPYQLSFYEHRSPSLYKNVLLICKV
jgi:hypothetical protein